MGTKHNLKTSPSKGCLLWGGRWGASAWSQKGDPVLTLPFLCCAFHPSSYFLQSARATCSPFSLPLTFCGPAGFPSLALPSYLPAISLNQKRAPLCLERVSSSPLDKCMLSSTSFTAHWAPRSATSPLPSTCEAHSLTPSCSEFSAHGANSLLCFALPALLAEIPSAAAPLTCKAQGRCFNPCLTFTSQGELMHTLTATVFS